MIHMPPRCYSLCAVIRSTLGKYFDGADPEHGIPSVGQIDARHYHISFACEREADKREYSLRQVSSGRADLEQRRHGSHLVVSTLPFVLFIRTPQDYAIELETTGCTLNM